ncbi:MAG: ATP-binding protein, partial [Proteobacteria bacterium]|nr:ATP-binding protein [Pseudomonadota bacterium]
MNSKRTLLSWSSGKDSAYALHLLHKDPSINLLGLFTTVNQKFERVAMHAVRLRLLKEQAKQIGLPIHIIEIPYPCSNADYEKIMTEFIAKIQADDIETVAFGDLYLEDIRDY